MTKIIDLTGQKFGKLTVIKFGGRNKVTLWECQCDCGNIKTISGKNLKSGQIKSCGCLRKEQRIDLTGRIFGRLTVIELVGRNKYKQFIWKCLCECGKIKNICGNSLKRNFTKSCGCLNTERVIESHRINKGESGFNLLFRIYRGSAKLKNLEFNLTKEEFSGLTQQNCYYCGDEPSTISCKTELNCSEESKEWSNYVYNGIDRTDNNKGYIIENCVPCCKECNYFKSNRNIENFIKYIKKIHDHISHKSLLHG